MRRIATAVALLAALSGCYFDRLTSSYDSVFEVTNTDDDSAVLDETGRDEESAARNRKRLMELDERARAQFGSSPLGQFKPRWGVAGLDERFAREELCAGEGLNAA